MLDETLRQLHALADPKYKAFNDSLVPGAAETTIGVRLPQLRALARDLCRQDWRQFLQQADGCPVYEIVMLQGLVTAGAKCDFDEKLRRTAAFLPKIDNWAVCDSFSSTLKDAGRNLEKTWDFLQPYLTSPREFEVRFSLVCMMDYFLTGDYIDRVLYTMSSVHHPGYYVKMAAAWCLSVCFVKFRDKTLPLLEAQSLDPWTHNKAIQKCRESYRVSPADKALLQTLRVQTTS